MPTRQVFRANRRLMPFNKSPLWPMWLLFVLGRQSSVLHEVPEILCNPLWMGESDPLKEPVFGWLLEAGNSLPAPLARL